MPCSLRLQRLHHKEQSHEFGIGTNQLNQDQNQGKGCGSLDYLRAFLGLIHIGHWK